MVVGAVHMKENSHVTSTASHCLLQPGSGGKAAEMPLQCHLSPASELTADVGFNPLPVYLWILVSNI